MRTKALIIASILLTVVSCSEFDDSLIWEKLNDHEDRLVKLELLCESMNSGKITRE